MERIVIPSNQSQPAPSQDIRESVTESTDKDSFRKALQGVTVCLLVAQVLLPADGTTATRGAGIPLVMLWLLLFVTWIGNCLWRKREAIRGGIADLAMLLLVLLHTASGLWALRLASREAVNMTWQWIAAGCGFLLIRQLFTSPRECRALVAVFIALAVGLAGYGYYQMAVEIPATQQAYRENPAAEIKDAFGVDRHQTLNPLLQTQFEARLADRRPTATFILANSLAGFLVPLLVLCFGIAARGVSGFAVRVSLFTLAGMAGSAGVLLATHSRTALLAAVCGICLSGIWLIGGGDEKPSAKRIFSGFFVLGLLIVAVAGLLSTNQVWLAGARRSLWFRIEYWQATAGMIADAPWLGWGPGNFRDLYTAYKLPGSLEEVADPHNMILELWATAGTPAMLAMVALLAFFFVEILARPIAPARATTDRLRPGQPIWQVPLGAVAGLPLAWLLGFVFHPLIGPSARPVAILLVAAGLIVMLAGIWQWVERGVLTRTLLAAATAAMLINLSAAGGLGNPGISTGLWLLLAVGLNLVPQAFEGWQPPRLATGAALLLGVGLLAACQWTAYRPLVDGAVARDRARIAAQRNDPDGQWHALLEANRADRRSAETARDSVAVLFRELQLCLLRNDPDQQSVQQRLTVDFAAVANSWQRRAPYSAAVRKQIGDMYLQLYRRSGQRDFLEAAVEMYLQAAARYPHNGLIAAHLAWAESLAQNTERAKTAARRALQLDNLQVHPQLKLQHESQRLADPQIEAGNTRARMEKILQAH